MKKQFLLIALAMFAGITVYGQALHNSIPRTLDLVNDAGHPIAGTSYNYEAIGTPAGGQFTFWATKDANFISTSGAVTTVNSASQLKVNTGDLIATSVNYGAPALATQVSITWSDAILSGTGNTGILTPTFVAAHYSNAAAGGVDNFNAWEIQPIKAFIVDVKNIEDVAKTMLAYGATEDQNADIVRSAAYVAGNNRIEYDFGTNTLYFEVVAANFSGSWAPTLSVAGLDATESADIMWTYDDPIAKPWTVATVWNAATAPVVPHATVTDFSLGVSIYVRVIVTHKEYEGIADRPITLEVDGLSLVGDYDVLNNTEAGATVTPATPTVGPDKADVAMQTIKARPALTTPVAPAPQFLPGNKKN
jgi:hypothetical protein